MEYDDLPLINNTELHSFEIMIDSRRAFIDYKQRGDTVYLVHTEVPEDIQGQGIAGALVEKTFNYLDAHHMKMVPYCAFIKAYLKRHPQWGRLLADK